MSTDEWKYIDQKHKEIIPYVSKENEQEISITSHTHRFLTVAPKIGVAPMDKNKLRITKEGSYSVTKPNQFNVLHKYLNEQGLNLRNLTVTETNAGIGGLTVQLGYIFGKLQLFEINKLHAEILEHNINTYNKYSPFKCGIYLSKASYLRDDKYMKIEQDIIISDPPWGGLDYKKHDKIRLGFDNIDITYIINRLYEANRFKYFILLVPENFDMEMFKKHITAKKYNILRSRHVHLDWIVIHGK